MALTFTSNNLIGRLANAKSVTITTDVTISGLTWMIMMLIIGLLMKGFDRLAEGPSGAGRQEWHKQMSSVLLPYCTILSILSFWISYY